MHTTATTSTRKEKTKLKYEEEEEEEEETKFPLALLRIWRNKQKTIDSFHSSCYLRAAYMLRSFPPYLPPSFPLARSLARSDEWHDENKVLLS